MIFKLKYKIFLSITVLLLAAIGGMVYLLQESFDRSFLQYVNEYEQEAQNNLIANLGEEYQSHGNWDAIRQDEDRWNDLVVSNFARATSRHQNSNSNNDSLPRDILDLDDPNRNISKRERRFYRSNVALLDVNKQHVVGREIEEPEGTEFKPIYVNSDVVGYLAARPLLTVLETPDIEFSNQQIRGFNIIAVVIALLTFVLSIPLARYLVTRINTLATGTRELASGNYSIRIPYTSNDELGKLSQDFNVLARTLEENEKARCQWIADISHELRTPLAILRGEIEAIQDQVRKLTPETLENLHSEVMNLDRLVKDLYELSMSDIGALTYQKQKLNLLESLQQSVSIFNEEFEKKNIRVELVLPPGPIWVLGDRDRFGQLFANLLTNSLRYTDTGGKLEIKVIEKPEQVELQFNDTEPSVPDAEIPRLFDRLYRVESSRSRETGGTGLGLAICKNIVEAHQGSISAWRSPYDGLQITIELPLAR
jgi:two-component system sensor histidine kinase BaeS